MIGTSTQDASQLFHYLFRDWRYFLCNESGSQLRLYAKVFKLSHEFVHADEVERRVINANHHPIDVGHMLISYHGLTSLTQE